MRRYLLSAVVLLPVVSLLAQTNDSLDTERLTKMISLSEVIVRSGVNISAFIERVKEDTSFYKAFRTLRIIGYTSLNNIQMLNKDGQVIASMESKTVQHRKNNCRSMDVLEEKTTGDFFTRKKVYNYYTAELYASLFFTNGIVCDEDNIVKGNGFSTRSKSGIEKHKEQLKMLFFNPGKKIPGIPFIGNKTNIFDPEVAQYYNFSIDYGENTGEPCYVFTVRARDDLSASEKDNIVIDNMTTWFSTKTMEVLARNYDLSYAAGVYDFDVHMEVQMARIQQLLVPQILRYKGSWHVLFKKRERGIFTATLFDFKTANK
ncbi:MAG TPA: hypothetical protein VFS36_11615 [Chitinophagaceae bacterium]|jgi:hypothetical protein|nr:hypothetical protein [Chitinophagaceae bacterium]